MKSDSMQVIELREKDNTITDPLEMKVNYEYLGFGTNFMMHVGLKYINNI